MKGGEGEVCRVQHFLASVGDPQSLPLLDFKICTSVTWRDASLSEESQVSIVD